MSKTTNFSSKRATFTILSTVNWEFFSYFGMRALLILYLTQYLHFDDIKAYSLYGSYITLVFLTPILGGLIADHLLGFRQSVILGCLCIIIGHLILGFTEIRGLYIGLALLAMGVGFFKSNAICLLADAYQHDKKNQDSVFIWYYVFANLGATLGPIACAYIAQYYGWNWGFMLAGLGMLSGLIIFLSQFKILKTIGAPPRKLSKKICSFLFFSSIITFCLLIAILKNNLTAWVLMIALIIATPFMIKIYRETNKSERKNIAYLGLLTGFSTLFWAFDQQGGSSVSLFILRNVSKVIANFTVPTAWFQSINPAIILLAGPVLALLLGINKTGKQASTLPTNKNKKHQMLADPKNKTIHQDLMHNLNLNSLIKLSIGLLLLTLGFSVFWITASLKISEISMFWPIIGLSLIGIGELFIDPIILSEINKSAPPQSRGFFTGLYYLFAGAYANYASVQIAKLSVYFTANTLQSSRLGYSEEFKYIVFLGCILCVLLWIIYILLKKVLFSEKAPV